MDREEKAKYLRCIEDLRLVAEETMMEAIQLRPGEFRTGCFEAAVNMFHEAIVIEDGLKGGYHG